AMTYNWPRAEVYAYLGRAADMVPILQKSMGELPNEYDPPYRLAWIYTQTGELDKALLADKRAATLRYGPRKARILTMIADIEKGRGDVEAEREARKALVAHWEGLPEGQKNPDALDEARAALAAMDAPAAE